MIPKGEGKTNGNFIIFEPTFSLSISFVPKNKKKKKYFVVKGKSIRHGSERKRMTFLSKLISGWQEWVGLGREGCRMN